MTEASNPKLTRLIVWQFEQLRKTNRVNMLDPYAVYQAAKSLGMDELANLSQEDFYSYLEIITRRKHYLRKYRLPGYR